MKTTVRSSTGKAELLQHPAGRQVVWVGGCPHRGSVQYREAEIEQEPGDLSRVAPSPAVRADVPAELAAVRSFDPVDSGPAAEALCVFNLSVVMRSIEGRHVTALKIYRRSHGTNPYGLLAHQAILLSED